MPWGTKVQLGLTCTYQLPLPHTTGGYLDHGNATACKQRMLHTADLRGTSMWKPVLGSFSPRRAGSSFLSFPSSQSMQTSRIASRTLHNQGKFSCMIKQLLAANHALATDPAILLRKTSATMTYVSHKTWSVYLMQQDYQYLLLLRLGVDLLVLHSPPQTLPH